MALAYLNAGAVSLAATNWSDATGFADNATPRRQLNGQNVSSDLDYFRPDHGYQLASYSLSG